MLNKFKQWLEKVLNPEVHCCADCNFYEKKEDKEEGFCDCGSKEYTDYITKETYRTNKAYWYKNGDGFL